MATINFNPRTTPIAIVGIGGAIFLLVIYANAFGHLDTVLTFFFCLVGIAILIGGVYLYMWGVNTSKAWKFS